MTTIKKVMTSDEISKEDYKNVILSKVKEILDLNSGISRIVIDAEDGIDVYLASPTTIKCEVSHVSTNP